MTLACRVRTVACLACAAVAFFGACGPKEGEERGDPAAVLRRAAAYLWTEQGSDGGWHSGTHGILKGGQAWTAFTSFYLLQVPDSIHVTRKVQRDRALEFIRERISEDG
ncbi:MAG: hypothetical protein R3282_02655, partial [Rhodothermales bacterium]|nr:hypothetical protein [Rhodothermales bacterium]